MQFNLISLFPEMFRALEYGIVGRSLSSNIIQLRHFNPRDYTTDIHRTVDDRPYGGGPGMVMKVEPLQRAVLEAKSASPTAKTLYLSPQGQPLTQSLITELANAQCLILIAGRYEGIDQRIIDEYVDDELSIGDYVLSSGEIASLVIIDAVYRLREGVIKARSLEEESFSDGFLLEYPQYTRPEVFRDRSVPEVLLSGHHKNISDWRRQQSFEKTKRLRPDLLA